MGKRLLTRAETAVLADDMNRLQKENDELRALAKELSHALIKARPLGGSELFIQRCGDYYADPVYCGQLVEKQHREAIELRLEVVRLQRSQRNIGDSNG